MIKSKILVFLCSFLFTFNLIASDHDFDKEHEKFEEYKKNYHISSKHHLYKNLDYLDLSESQLSSLKDVMKKYKKEYKKFYKFKRKKEKELSSLMREEILDKDKYKEILSQINSKAMKLEINNLEKIHTILNEKQKEKFSYFLQEWRVE